MEALVERVEDGVSDSPAIILELNKTIKKLEEDFEDLKFNTAIAQLMIMVNTFYQAEKISLESFKTFLLILAPVAPFLSEELWHRVGQDFSIHQKSWPAYDKNILNQELISLAVQFNGKTRGVIEVERDLEELEVLDLIKESENLKKYLNGEIKKVIYIKNKIINIVI